jgi:hypothetical protein
LTPQPQPREQDRIQCLECGRWYRALPTHLRRSHDLSDEDYRLRHGIPVGVPLVCLEWSERQCRRNVELGLGRHLTARGPSPGFRQRESVRRLRKPDYGRLAASGTSAASSRDRTAARRDLLRPYPVTIAQAAERLGCSKSAAYTFLSHCIALGRLKRVGRGCYDEEIADAPQA